MPALIELHSVTKTFHVGDEDLHALNNLNLSVQPGEFIAITGPSGSGKSTLANIIGGLDKPTSGTVSVDGAPHRKKPKSARPTMQTMMMEERKENSITVFKEYQEAADAMFRPRTPCKMRERLLQKDHKGADLWWGPPDRSRAPPRLSGRRGVLFVCVSLYRTTLP